MNILMVYPRFPPTYWGFDYALKLMGKKASMPPLGLLTIAALTPREHPIRLIDLNCQDLDQPDIDWADLIALSAMITQKESLFETAQRCRSVGKRVVLGGPYATACPDECAPYVDVLVCNEGEITWPLFLNDLARGSPKSLYTTEDKPDIRESPLPRFDLIALTDYLSIPVQFSRGCPFQCEFCDITVLFGRRPRTKAPAQVLEELETLYQAGYRGQVFIVDDNFIGNKKEVKALLRALTAWNQAHRNPFSFGTEASVNLADDRSLLGLMVRANFLWVFLGLETPSPDGLQEAGKLQNLKGSLLTKVRVIQEAGLAVYGGFIIGFDSDDETIFERQIAFITEAAIPSAMVGPLVALPGTPLYARLKQEGRLLQDANGQQQTVASGSTNIVTRMAPARLSEGYAHIMQTLYQPETYFRRVITTFERIGAQGSVTVRLRRFLWLASVTLSGVASQRRRSLSLLRDLGDAYRLLSHLPPAFKRPSVQFALAVAKRHPDQLPLVIPYILMGYHYFRFTKERIVRLPEAGRRATLRDNAF